jgi:hypothetical protein
VALTQCLRSRSFQTPWGQGAMCRNLCGVWFRKWGGRECHFKVVLWAIGVDSNKASQEECRKSA